MPSVRERARDDEVKRSRSETIARNIFIRHLTGGLCKDIGTNEWISFAESPRAENNKFSPDIRTIVCVCANGDSGVKT